MKLFGFKKNNIPLPEDPRKFFISNPTAKLNWFWNREKKIQKWIFRGILIAIGVWILVTVFIGIGQGITWQKQYKPDPTVLKFIPWNFIMIGVIHTLWRLLIHPFLHILNLGHTIMLHFGGQGLMYVVFQDGQIGKIVAIFAGVGILMFVVALSIRGIKIAAARNAEMQEAYKQNTGVAILGSVLGIFILTFGFFLLTGLVCILGQWIITTVCGINSIQIGTLVFNYGMLEGIQHYSELPAYVPGGFLSVFSMTALAVAAAVFLTKFLIAIFGSIMKLAVMMISAFVSLGKWPQDEGASFQGHKDDMISLMLNYLIAYFIFQFFMIMIGIIAPMTENLSGSMGTHTVVALVMFAAGAVSLTELQKRLPEIFMMSRNPSPNGRGNEVSGQVQHAKSQGERAAQSGGRDFAQGKGKDINKNMGERKQFMKDLKKDGFTKKNGFSWKDRKAAWKVHKNGPVKAPVKGGK